MRTTKLKCKALVKRFLKARLNRSDLALAYCLLSVIYDPDLSTFPQVGIVLSKLCDKIFVNDESCVLNLSNVFQQVNVCHWYAHQSEAEAWRNDSALSCGSTNQLTHWAAWHKAISTSATQNHSGYLPCA